MHRVTVLPRHRPSLDDLEAERARLAGVWRAAHVLGPTETHALVVYATARHVTLPEALDDVRRP